MCILVVGSQGNSLISHQIMKPPQLYLKVFNSTNIYYYYYYYYYQVKTFFFIKKENLGMKSQEKQNMLTRDYKTIIYGLIKY